MAPKTIPEYFPDWEATAFGFGYGTGEPHIIPLLRRFFELCPQEDAYAHQALERDLGAANAWFLINVLCRHDVGALDYGSSPRYAWLTAEGRLLRQFLLSKTADELVAIVAGREEDDTPCYPNACNCGPNGYERGRVCPNPFWPRRQSRP